MYYSKEGSKLVMAVRGGASCDTQDGWPIVDVFPVLGHHIGANGKEVFCYGETVKQAWKAFWRNASKRCVQKLPITLSAKRLARMVLPIIPYR